MKNITFKHHNSISNSSSSTHQLLGYWTYNIDRKTWSLSHELEMALSISSKEIKNRSLLDDIHPHDQAIVAQQFMDARTLNHPFNASFRFQIKGEYRLVSIQSRIDEQDGKMIAYYGTIEDITDQVIKDLESSSKLQLLDHELNQLKKLLDEERFIHQQTSQAKSTFLSTMSHEIRTPMNAMIGFTHLLSETTLQEDQKEYVSRIEDAQKHLLSIINDILDLSKMEAGKMTLEKRPFMLAYLLKDVKELFTNQAEKKRLYIDVETIHCPKMVIGDQMRIKQILINLMSNAIKFTDMGGISVVVSCEALSDSQVEVTFKVKDTGIGMSALQQERLFAEYEQASTATTRLYGGTGLGLSISHKLATLMKGQLIVTSKLNEGSTFSLVLPLHIDEHDDHEHHEDIITKKYRKNAHILVAEDHVLSQKLVERLLQNLDQKVTLVENGQEALDLMKHQSFDLVFLDMNMPVLDGVGAAKAMRRFNTKTPIVALTANQYPEERSACLLAGMNDILVKPIDIKALQDALVKWIPEE